jgi:hypothetical protein
MPDDFGRLLRSMLGPPEPQPGPPYLHVAPFHPLTGEELAAVRSGPRGRLHELAPLEPFAEFRRLAGELLKDTGNVGCYWPLTDAE